MKGAGALLFVFVGILISGVLGFWERFGVSGQQVRDGVGTGVGAGTETTKSLWNQLVSEPWGYTAIAAGITAALGIATWKRIGGFGRGVVILLAGVTVGVVLWGTR